MIKKRLLLLIAFAITSLIAFPQEKSILKGQITDAEQNPLAGVHVFIQEFKSGTITNDQGEYYFSKVSSENLNIQITYIGYESQLNKISIKKGLNTFDFILKETAYSLEGVMVTAQKREQQIKDVPISITAISSQTITDLSIESLDQFADFVPGLNVRVQSTQRPNFVIRGLSSDEVSPNAQPRVSLFFNYTPITRASGGVLELYDMDRVEVLKGPQGTLFGRGAQIGAVHFLTKMPTNNFGGYISSGIGNFAKKEISAAVNLPIIKNKLNTRIAAIYNSHDGYVKNTFGGNLNGKDTKGIRFSARYLPSEDTKIDFIFNFQQDRAPGVAFISGIYPNTNGVLDVFAYEASLNKGEDLKVNKDVSNFILNFRHHFNESLFLTTITSYQTNKSFGSWDGDGSAAAAIDMSEAINAKLFNQEVRLNYALGNKLNGFSGFNYLRENVEQTYHFSSNEQHLAYLILQMPQYMINADGTPNDMPGLPLALGGMPLPIDHNEESIYTAKNIATEFFTDATYQINAKLSLSAGFRIVFDNSTVSNQAKFVSGSPSTLGLLIPMQPYPNLFFKPAELNITQKSFSGLTGRLVASYKVDQNTNLFASYSRGRRPNVIQYQSDGSSEVFQDEVVDHFEIGLKSLVNEQFLFDVSFFYYNYKHFQTSAWISDPSSGNFAYLIQDAGKASSYGFETSFQYSISEAFKIFGNYSYIHARFSDEDSDGSDQEYAGNQFRLTPDHSFGLGAKFQMNLNSNMQFFAIPSTAFKSHFYFEDANEEGIEQDAYLLVNMSTGIKLMEPSLTFTLYSHNLLNEKYLISAGNTGSLFGVPTFIPSMPRTFGFKIQWDF